MNVRHSLPFLLAGFSIVYGLAVLWYVPTQPSLGLHGMLVNPNLSAERGVEIVDVRESGQAKPRWPIVGERIVQVGPISVRNFHDLLAANSQLRHLVVDPGGQIEFGVDPSEDAQYANRHVVEFPDRSRLVRVWVEDDDGAMQATWVPLVGQPAFGVSLSLLWFGLQMLVVLAGVLACWYRPFDLPVRAFLVLAALGLMAFLGGNHWWVVSENLWLLIPFVIAGVFLPGALAHFAMVYPVPKVMVSRAPGWCRLLILGPGTVGVVLLSGLILGSRVMGGDWGSGPYAHTLERLTSNVSSLSLPILRILVLGYQSLFAAYFVFAVWLLWGSVQQARSPVERSQARTLFSAASFALVPLGYSYWLSIVDPSGFALGGGRVPIFLASLAFMLAYGIGIVRYKLLLIDQMLSRGVWYYAVSAGMAIALSAIIAIGSVNALHQDLSLFGQAVPMVQVLMLSVLVLIWGRDTVQRWLDRRFFREKYRLDRALQRMDRVVSNVFEREAVAESLLNSCCDVLQAEHAVLFVRKGQGNQFRLLASVGRTDCPLQIHLDNETLQALAEDSFLQRIPSGQSSSQVQLRKLNSQLLYGMELDGALTGILALGPKHNGAAYVAEDVAFATALGRMTSVALHCAKVHEEVGRLNDDLQLKVEKISEQERQILALQSELSALSMGDPAPLVVSVGQDEFHRGGIKGSSPAIQRVLETVRKVAQSESTVLIRGESGTGKELLAKAIHENSSRRNGPLVTVHCAALSPALLESELFGHVKGAFTDAREDKVGRFALANGGTLFLDEIGDVSSDVQVKLLRVLQERTFEPVGGTRSQSVDVRLITATHQNLEELIVHQQFREDLFYRLNVISVTLPPLRERQEDLFELSRHFLQQACQKTGKSIRAIDAAAFELLQAHAWPGNIRELQNVVERAVVLAETDRIEPHDLPPEVRSRRVLSPSRTVTSLVPAQTALRHTAPPVGEDEVAALEMALVECGGNKAEAARKLGMPRSTFFSKLKKHGLG
ncbi:MAG: sigma 54-interacting transcriptional regulator [Planctomycetaceae bacterium]|nr:sigma 54-interacting transcriptional regulator [Planctomycetaceae bacterium]